MLGSRYSHTCDVCKKRGYLSKKQAKRQGKVPGQAMRPYTCDGTIWHLGHLPREVRDGRVTIQEYLRLTGKGDGN